MLLYCFSICFSYEKFHQEIFKRKEIFKWNSYPEKFENQKNRIQCCLKKNTPVFNLKEVFQSRRWLSTLFTLKDKINKMLHPDSTIVYKCNICNDLYYGKAKHHFKFRACEHLGITPLTRKMVKKPKREYLIIIPKWVITHILMILKPFSKSLMNLDFSESCFWYCVMILL